MQKMMTVYSSITSTADGVESTTTTHTAESLGGDCIFVLVCPNLRADATDMVFTITTFYTNSDSQIIYNSEETVTVQASVDLD